MATKLIIERNATTGKIKESLVLLSPAEEAAIVAEQDAAITEAARRAALTPEGKAEEDILRPLFDNADSGQLKLLKALALTLLDGLNQERAARGVAKISPAQLRAAVRSKLGAQIDLAGSAEDLKTVYDRMMA